MTFAGAIEFTPQDIALILAVIIGLAIFLTAPGWVAVGVATARRSGRRGARRGWAFTGGALLGLAVAVAAGAVVVPLLSALGASGLLLAMPLLWAACWGVAWLIWPRPGARGTGWGR